MRKVNTKYFSEEDHLHYQIVEWMSYEHKNAFFIHVRNETGAKVTPTMMNKMRALGVRKGVPDLLFFDPRHGYTGLAIEVKTPQGTVTKEQREFLANLKERGWLTAVVRSFEQAKQIIDDYYGKMSKM